MVYVHTLACGHRRWISSHVYSGCVYCEQCQAYSGVVMWHREPGWVPLQIETFAQKFQKSLG